MKSLMLTTSLALAAIGSAWANEGSDAAATAAYQPVDGFRIVGRLDNWRAIDRDSLIIWATPSRPYLIELMRKTPTLRNSEVIGVTSTVGRVTKFDEILVDGWNYPIKAIYKLDREQARELREMPVLEQNA